MKSAASNPILGLILPPPNRPVPDEALAMYPQGVEFRAACLGLLQMTPEGYDSVLHRIVPAAEELARGGARAICLMGTSLTFYRGAAFNQELVDSIAEATGLPATSMSTGIVQAMREAGSRRLAVATAYAAEVNGRLRTFLEESGFEVVAMDGLGFEKTGEAMKVSPAALTGFVLGVRAKAADADGLLISCGGFRTLELLPKLRELTGLPVVSSTPHAIEAGVRLLGLARSAALAS